MYHSCSEIQSFSHMFRNFIQSVILLISQESLSLRFAFSFCVLPDVNPSQFEIEVKEFCLENCCLSENVSRGHFLLLQNAQPFWDLIDPQTSLEFLQTINYQIIRALLDYLSHQVFLSDLKPFMLISGQIFLQRATVGSRPLFPFWLAFFRK